MLVALQPEDTQKAKKYADRALETYRQVLQKNEGNIYAANGIGAAIAELGRLQHRSEGFHDGEPPERDTQSFLAVLFSKGILRSYPWACGPAEI